MAKRVEAEVILRPSDTSQAPIAKGGAARGSKVPQTAHEISRALQALGFEVVAISPLTISIAGREELFKRVFDTEHVLDANTSLKIPSSLEDRIEGVYPQAPPIYFG